MLFILLSWVYIFTTTLVVGTSASKIFRLQAINPIIAILFGCFSITLLTGFWAVFAPINALFFGFIMLLTAILFFINKIDIFNKLTQLKNTFTDLKPIFKTVIILIAILILAKCASAPFIVDNETYYIQTIKWLNQFGFTKGLTNLHPFLGQTSGWHLLQSGYNLAFMYGNLNDLSGFCLLLGNLYAIKKLNDYTNQTTKNRINLVVGLFPVFNVFLFQFIGAPSPDIAIYVIGIIIFYEFVRCYKEYNMYSFYAIFILSVFATFIKLTGLVFFVFALVLYFYFYIYTRKNTLGLLVVSLITFILFITKNTIITGHPLYPLPLSYLKQDWSLPNTVHQYLSQYDTAASYGLTIDTYENTSLFKRLLHWFTQGKLDSVFNALFLLCIAIVPFLFKKLKISKPIKIIYFTSIGFILFLFLFSPQYRFYFPFLMFFVLLIASMFIKNRKLIITLICSSVLLPIIPLLFNINSSMLSNTANHQNTSAFSIDYLIKPHSNSRYSNDNKPFVIGNTTIHSITNGSDFIWETGNAPLPALNKQQLEYLKTYFKVIPQQYSSDLNDGFYSKTLEE